MPQPVTDENSYDHVFHHGTDAGGPPASEGPLGEERASNSEEERERAGGGDRQNAAVADSDADEDENMREQSEDDESDADDDIRAQLEEDDEDDFEPADDVDFDNMSPKTIRRLLALLDVVEQLPAAIPNHMLGPGAVQYAASTKAFLDDPANWELNVAEKGGLLRLFQELVKLERNEDGINELNRIMASNAALLQTFFPAILPFFRAGGRGVFIIPLRELSADALNHLRAWQLAIRQLCEASDGEMTFCFVNERNKGEIHATEFLVGFPGGKLVNLGPSGNLDEFAVGLRAAQAKSEAERKRAPKSLQRLSISVMDMRDAGAQEHVVELGTLYNKFKKRKWIVWNAPALGEYIADILHDSVELQRQKRTQTILNAAFKLKMGARPKQPMSARERLNFAFATNFDFEDDSDDSDNSQDDSNDEKDDGLKDDETDSSAESDDGLDPPQLAKSDIAQVRKTKSKAYRKAKKLHKHEWTPEELEQLEQMHWIDRFDKVACSFCHNL
ncbi:hypothetical protein Rhopal_004938-T1 [Rhodotorula paludigena]|uniref:Uncharacterized protein n=1 Tax=Rhodotorula paludigena TaxID=86838 RepID=A0AAV5GTG5_9BASI|nr:hypothetical protein Rhopal_004938-T1 [Rhodotorula paludigena]